MANMRPKTESVDIPKRLNGRRSFIWKAGAAISALAASAVAGVSKSHYDPNKSLKDRIGRLEDAVEIRRLHQLYESRLSQSLYEEVPGMFADNAEVVYNGGLFSGKKSIRRLFCGRFASGFTGKKIDPAPGFEPDPAERLDVVEVAQGRKSAVGRFSYSIQVGAPMISDSSLVEMARLHGEGIMKWWEGGVQEASFVKVGESWKIHRMEYRATSKADYRPGRAQAKPIEVPIFSRTYPEDPMGPDSLV